MCSRSSDSFKVLDVSESLLVQHIDRKPTVIYLVP